ncbi:MAG: hypothetical protein NTW87_28985 [Planctomycetota bacterium]|nr:hypothetical protein [Planctomycetota bacterium]
MADLPLPKVSAAARQRLNEYLKLSGESKQDVALGGPAEPRTSEDRATFPLICARDLISEDPSNGFHYLHLANAYIAVGDCNSAVAVYEYLDNMKCQFMGYYDDPMFNMGIVEADRGHFDAATKCLACCAIRYPEASGSIAFYEGTIHHEMGEYVRAEACYERALKVARNDEAARIRTLLDNAKKHLKFVGKRKSPWMEFIH